MKYLPNTVRHYSREERKESFSYTLKISNAGDRFSRSMSGVCTPFNIEITEARSKRYMLDISIEVMENMCYSTVQGRKYAFKSEFSLFKSDS